MIDARIPLMGQQVDVVGMVERAQRMKLSQMIADQQQEAFEYKKQQDAAAAAQAQRKAQFDNVAMIAKLTTGVTPENYAQRLQTAQSMGIDVSSAPQQYDPQWIAEMNAVTSALSQQQEKMSSEAQKLIDAGLQPGSPEFEEAMMSMLFPDKYVVDQGYGYTRIGTRPGGTATRSAPPPPPPGFVINEGGTAGNGGGGFPGS